MVLEELRKEQEKLASKVITEDRFHELRLIGGVDQAFPRDYAASCIVVQNFGEFDIVEKAFSLRRVDFPYIAGFLSYREGPSIISAWRKLKTKPQVLLVDGNGILHPHRIGLASHIGVLLDQPTIGVAKSLLCGEVRGSRVFVNGEARACVLQSKEGCRPIYVSPGHKVSLDSSVKIVKRCIKSHKLPEPLRLAHRFVGDFSRDICFKFPASK